jgi:phage gp46-like protein
MIEAQLRLSEGCAADPFLNWDTIWSSGQAAADWKLADRDEALNVGGLRAKDALHTAIVLSLFTDRRVETDHPLYWLADGDPAGWWGDSIDLDASAHEGPLGSLLWLLRRAPMTIGGQSVSDWARHFAEEALSHLIEQGACVRIEVRAEAIEANSRLNLTVQLFGRDSANIYDRKFDFVWQQVGR